MSTADPRNVAPSVREATRSPASAGGPRLARARAALLAILYALLSLWALVMAQGAVLVISGHVPAEGSLGLPPLCQPLLRHLLR